MSQPVFRSSFDVDLIDQMGNDQAVCRAARVSTLGAASLDTQESAVDAVLAVPCGCAERLEAEAERHEAAYHAGLGDNLGQGFSLWQQAEQARRWAEFLRGQR